MLATFHRKLLVVFLMLFLAESSIAQPENSYQSGSAWYCNNGYKRVGDECVEIDVPANAWVRGSQWYCNNGYRRVGDECVEIDVPANAWVRGSQWYCNNGYKRIGDECVKFDVPTNATARGSQWFCNLGYRKVDDRCQEMTAYEKQQQMRSIMAALSRAKNKNIDGMEFSLRDIERY